MTDFPFAIVGFDLDGTFLDTSGDLTAAVNHALSDAGRPLLTVEQVKPLVGGGAKHMLEQGMAATGGCEAGELRRLYKLMLSFYEANISCHSRPFNGAVEAIDALDALGVKSAIVTNKFEGFARKLLNELGLIDRFATLIGGDTLGPGNAKPAAAPVEEMIRRLGGGRAAFIGDSLYDMMAAKNAGIPSVAVRFGFLMQPVEELGANAIIEHYGDLIPTLSTL